MAVTSGGREEKNWVRVALAWLTDAILFMAAFAVAAFLRFEERWQEYIVANGLVVLLGAMVAGCSFYLTGLYAAAYQVRQSRPAIVGKLLLGEAVAALMMIVFLYGSFSPRIGRGVMGLGLSLAAALHLVRHLWLYRARLRGENVAFVCGEAGDWREADVAARLGSSWFRFCGVITSEATIPAGCRWPHLGTIADLDRIIASAELDRVVVAASRHQDVRMLPQICRLRFAGVCVSSLPSFCEEVLHYVPVALVTPEWLLAASDSTQLFYVRKLKRAMDVGISLGALAVTAPLLALAALAVRLDSQGPVIYRQTRLGRWGRPFTILKLRTMSLDAEKNGAAWSSKDDLRVTRVGRWLRSYRVDEIPQLVNVLRGEMSLVGPRPERPEFIESLERAIPMYRERLLVQPGLTGWAQVNYPYGSSPVDARRKLEYDLYYMKHMGAFMDIFIGLETIRTLCLGAHRPARELDVTQLLEAAVPAASPVAAEEGPRP